ncbi:FAD-binding oxidoreductase, partial [Cellulomonas massiliensis]|uniref:FAD-binding oxidoreductase n=1 Tax=Cellulomonas massiliensis TaxID=1465811 RepID=UPI00037462C0
WSAARGVPVVPRGAGTGLAGAARAGGGWLVLDLSGLHRIREVSVADRLAVVEPGVVTADLDRAARAVGLRYAPDPGSWESSTVGGNIATNAGGLRCHAYGGTREAVLGLDVVLADGSLVRTGGRARRSVTGYDLTSLLVGSEGTLGVVVGATVRLDPLPAGTATLVASFADVEAAARAATAVTAAGVRPAALELLDEATLTAVDAAQGTHLHARGAALLLVRTEGFAAAAEADVVRDLVRTDAHHVVTSTDADEGERLAAVRRLALPSVERLGPVLVEDVAVPPSALAAAVRAVEHVAARTGVPIATFAHAGDGILHPLVRADHPRSGEAVELVVRAALGLGGTLTGEHGVGRTKRAWLDLELDPATRALHRRLKDALDPAGLLNPGVAI